MDDKTILQIFQILIDNIGADKFDVFEKIELYKLTNGELFNCEEVLEMLEIQRKIAEMEKNNL